ncbi:MAG: divergent polysaccharide deacetylase family protein [Pseudomonadota bacterium]
MRFIIGLALSCTLLLAFANAAHAVNRDQRFALPAIAIIIDDLGYRRDLDRQASELPGDVSFAIMPFAPHIKPLVSELASRGKETILHLPMEAADNNHLLGPGALTTSMDRATLSEAFALALSTVPRVVGVNNHMGSKFTQDTMRMGWLMSELASKSGLFYVDSRTTRNSVAHEAARRAGVDFLERDVFLDHIQDEMSIETKFDELIESAKRKGYSLGIAHPRPATLRVLERRLRALGNEGVRLESVSKLIRMQSGQYRVTPVSHSSLGNQASNIASKPTNPNSQTPIGKDPNM